VFLVSSSREQEINEVLLSAIRSLSAGIASLKIAVELLTTRVEDLHEDVLKLTKLMTQTLSEFQERSEKLITRMSEFSEKTPSEFKMSFDLFLERLSKKVSEMMEEYNKLLDELSLIRGKLSEGLISVFSECNELKSEVATVRSSNKDLSLLLTELLATFERESAAIKAKLHDIELLLVDMSVRVGKTAEVQGELREELKKRSSE